MDIQSSIASQAYAATRRIAAPEGIAPSDGAALPDISALVRHVTATVDRGESTARAALTGGADPHALVEALASSQSAVETVATIRDRVVEAYQEILRMPI